MIPGAEVVIDHPSNIMLNRLKKALVYIRKNPDMTIIVSGAKGAGDKYSEAEVMKQFLENSGIEAYRIYKDEKSLNTYQNISNTIEVINNINNVDNPKLMIVTNDYHTFRCKLITKSLGIEAYCLNVPTHYSVVPICYITEYFSLIKIILQTILLGVI